MCIQSLLIVSANEEIMIVVKSAPLSRAHVTEQVLEEPGVKLLLYVLSIIIIITLDIICPGKGSIDLANYCSGDCISSRKVRG